MTKLSKVPELLAIQAVLNLLEPFNPAEQERIVKVAVAMLGHGWAGTLITTNKARRIVNNVAATVAALRRA